MLKKKFSTNFITSKGRLYKEKEDVNRSIYQRDRDRVIQGFNDLNSSFSPINSVIGDKF